MLAQNFKTPADLGINDAEFDALFKVLGMLERGELIHRTDSRHPNGFNMNIRVDTSSCGTMACLLGWAQIVGGNRIFSDKTVDKNNKLLDLFMYLSLDDRSWNSCPKNFDRSTVSTAQAAVGLRNYMTHGDPRWAEALAE